MQDESDDCKNDRGADDEPDSIKDSAVGWANGTADGHYAERSAPEGGCSVFVKAISRINTPTEIAPVIAKD